MIATPASLPHSHQYQRLVVASAFAAFITAFFLAHASQLSELKATALNDISWALACGVATLLSLNAARVVTGRERLAWRAIALAQGLWFAGQCVWMYFELVLGGLPKFPHWVQIPFSAYDWIFVTGLLLIPKPPEASEFTLRHGGNIALILCTLAVTFIIALLEPAFRPESNPASAVVAALHCLGLASMSMAALYLLWSYRWHGLYWPLLLILAGALVHTATYIAYVHQLMTASYVANDWSNASWLFVFGAYACAAHERAWNATHRPFERKSKFLLNRERWLEALVPAMLIAIMLAVVLIYSEWLTRRTVTWATLAGLMFVVVLGLREVWIQRHEQRLLAALGAVNDGILAANRELSQSEARYRGLSAELEQRVAERTVELQQAYKELENFSYAVAHDLKAPLRSVDGFGSMLSAEYSASLDDKGRGYLQRMRNSALKMSELIDDLLAYARVDQRDFELTAISLPALIEVLIVEQRDEIERHGVQLQTNITALTVRADYDGLMMACRNLLQNAIKFSRDSKPPKIVISVDEIDGGVCMSICDNGIGFEMDHHDRIFEMFQRLHRADEFPGTGIGLAIVRKAIERMGGKVWTESQPGSGATFYVRLQRFDSRVQKTST